MKRNYLALDIPVAAVLGIERRKMAFEKTNITVVNESKTLGCRQPRELEYPLNQVAADLSAWLEAERGLIKAMISF